MSFVVLFVLIGLSLLLLSGQIVLGLTQTSPVSAAGQTAAKPTGAPTAPAPVLTAPFFAPSNLATPELQLPGGQYVLYQDDTHIYLVSTTDKTLLRVYTPGYTYSQAVHPLLTPGGQLLYSGDQGIWLADLFDQHPTQIASLNPGMVVTSLALSQDGQAIAWTTEPVDGSGQIETYAGPLHNPQLVREQSTLDCPCLRIFSFLNESTASSANTLLLTDDRGSESAVQYGLWALDLANPLSDPRLILSETGQQGPLAFVPHSTMLLYAPYEGAVASPTDESVPADVAALSYANSMNIAALDGASLTLSNQHVVLPWQRNQATGGQGYWITTPTFAPDGQTLAYVEFSSDPQAPYDRHSAVYTVQISGSGARLHVGHPRLVTISTTRLLELGPWLNNHVILLYGDSAIYALDTQSNALTTLVQADRYLRILGTVAAY